MNQNLSITSDVNDEISFSDLILFFQTNWKIIFNFFLAGLVAALAFLFIMPNKYEAIAQIKMGQFSHPNLGTINIETPSLLVARLKLPSSFPSTLLQTCAIPYEKDEEKKLRWLKANVLNNTEAVVEARVRHQSVKQAALCANILFEMIKQQQEIIVSPFLKTTQQELDNLKKQLVLDKDFIRKITEKNIQPIAYLATRDDIRNIEERIRTLKETLNFYNNSKTALVSPIYSSAKVVFPQKIPSLIGGILIGLLLGLGYVFSKRIWEK